MSQGNVHRVYYSRAWIDVEIRSNWEFKYSGLSFLGNYTFLIFYIAISLVLSNFYFASRLLSSTTIK